MSGKQKSKIMTIISHEYTTKTKTKGFIISTILGPLGMLAFIGVIVLATYISTQSSSKKVAVIDRTQTLGAGLVKMDPDQYFLSHESESDAKNKVLAGTYDGYLIIPQDILTSNRATVFSQGGGGIAFIASIEENLNTAVRQERLKHAGIDSKLLESVEKKVDVETQKLTEKGSEKDYAEVFAGLGYFAGFAIYIMILLYGYSVMRGVIEEKTNRIVEVIASSARPFEIMMGKVVGIGAVGLTQMLIWIIFLGVTVTLGGPFIAKLINGDSVTAAMNVPGGTMPQMQEGFQMPSISVWLYIGFLFYFLSGYFVYSTLYAAVGSAVDQESDAQQLQWPVLIPILLPMMFFSVILSDPDGTLSVVLSLIPLFTPILMMARITATAVPMWQIILSVILMIGTFFGAVWLAARIYRVGILMYGKKPTIGDLLKWARAAK